MLRRMKTTFFAAALLGLTALAPAAEAKTADTYQVTGNVVSVDNDLIVVMKGKERFEITRDPADKTEIKVGDKVTIHYRMSETSVEKAADKAADKAKKKDVPSPTPPPK
jgi:hypothetical protein